jgi:hypothetical protein
MPPRYDIRILFHHYVFALNFLFFCKGRYRLLDRLILHAFYHPSQLVLDKNGVVSANGINCDLKYLIGPWWSLNAKPLTLSAMYTAKNKPFPRYSLHILHFISTWTSNKCWCWVTNICKIKKGNTLPKKWKMLQTFHIYKNVIWNTQYTQRLTF